MAQVWPIGLDSWVLQDGNYPDFVTGQRAEFAVAFAQGELCRATGNDKRTWRLIADSTYEVCAEVLHADRHAVVLDFGLSVYSNYQVAVPGHALRPGDWVEGTADLSVDPFFYFDGLVHRKRFPPLIYTWTIEAVLQQTAPWVVAKPGDLPGDDWAEGAIAQGSLRIRDFSKHGWAAIPQTDAWDDDDGSADYLLRCRREPAPPKSSRSANF